jgi:hypothetical protein
MKQFQGQRNGSADQEHIEPGFENESHGANLTCSVRPVDEMTDRRNTLYYPFHLCSDETLSQLLKHFHAVHFRDYMAVQLTPFFGTTAFLDRMGDAYPDLVSAGRLVQGYSTSGPLDADMEAAVGRDLADPQWRRLFHHAFTEQRRFQRGLFNASHGIMMGKAMIPGPAALLCLMDKEHAAQHYSVESIRRLSTLQSSLSESYRFEYGMALLKTSAAGVWTVRLAQRLELSVVTDSPGHSELLRHSLHREGIMLSNYLLTKNGVHLFTT